jgi:hypothetical protein
MVEPRRHKGGKEHEGKDCGASLAIGFGRKWTRINADNCGAMLAIEFATNAHELTRKVVIRR